MSDEFSRFMRKMGIVSAAILLVFLALFLSVKMAFPSYQVATSNSLQMALNVSIFGMVASGFGIVINFILSADDNREL